MAAATRQNLARDFIELLRTRALRFAADTATEIPKIWTVAAGVAAGTVTANKTWLIVELDNATITSLDEKAFGSMHPQVPDHTRV